MPAGYRAGSETRGARGGLRRAAHVQRYSYECDLSSLTQAHTVGGDDEQEAEVHAALVMDGPCPRARSRAKHINARSRNPAKCSGNAQETDEPATCAGRCHTREICFLCEEQR